MNSKVILLVEDNPSDVGLTRRAFEQARMDSQLVVVEDGQEALDYLFGTDTQAANQGGESPALVLLDLKLPKISGLEVLRRVRADARTSRQPIVMLTTSSEERDVAASYDLYANSYVRKPVDFKQFAAAIGQLGLYWLTLNEPPPETE